MKKLLLTASGIFLAASLYIGINSYKNINSVSDLLLANVEALATAELSDPSWFVYERPPQSGEVPGVNCYEGGNAICGR